MLPEDTSEVHYTSFTGYMFISYYDLVYYFGEPHKNNTECDEVDAEWFLKFSDGTVITIYNYKNGKNYLGDEGIDVEEIGVWNIGSKISHTKFGIIKSVLQKIGKADFSY
jgi:hypothetical protein